MGRGPHKLIGLIEWHVYCKQFKGRRSLYSFFFLSVCLISWDPVKRMTPDEACQHDWIKEGMVHRTRVMNRGREHRRIERSHDKGQENEGGSQPPQGHGQTQAQTVQDPYKTAAQMPRKGRDYHVL